MPLLTTVEDCRRKRSGNRVICLHSALSETNFGRFVILCSASEFHLQREKISAIFFYIFGLILQQMGTYIYITFLNRCHLGFSGTGTIGGGKIL